MENREVTQQEQVSEPILDISNSLGNLVDRLGKFAKKSEVQGQVCEDVFNLSKMLEDLQQCHLQPMPKWTQKNHEKLSTLVADALIKAMKLLCDLPMSVVFEFLDNVHEGIQDVGLEILKQQHFSMLDCIHDDGFRMLHSAHEDDPSGSGQVVGDDGGIEFQ